MTVWLRAVWVYGCMRWLRAVQMESRRCYARLDPAQWYGLCLFDEYFVGLLNSPLSLCAARPPVGGVSQLVAIETISRVRWLWTVETLID